jgi:MFS family permease
MAVVALPAGVAADRWGRKRLMVGADVVRMVATAVLASLLVADWLEFWMIPLVAVIEGTGAAIFSAAQVGALRSVVPTSQLPDAAAAQTGRRAAVQVAGPPLGGALFGVARALPFIVDCASYTCSTVSLLAMRTPFEETREVERSSVRSRIAEGFRFLWHHAFLRTTALLFSLSNFIGQGLLFALVIIARDDGLSSAAVGALLAGCGLCIVVGSFLSAPLRRRLPVRAVILLELWAGLGCTAFLVWPNVYVLFAGMLPACFVIPSTDSVVHGYRIAMTPDRLLGRAESVRSMISVSLAPLGPLVAGLLFTVSARTTIGVFAVAALVLAVWGTTSATIRDAPELAALSELA